MNRHFIQSHKPFPPPKPSRAETPSCKAASSMRNRNLLGSNPWRFSGISRVFRVLFYTTTETTTVSSSSTSSSAPAVDSLYGRISRARNPRISIIPVLNQWVDQGRDLKQAELQKIIRQLRKYRRFSHALQVLFFASSTMEKCLKM